MNSQMPQSPCRLLSYSIAYEKDTDDRCHPEYPEFDNIVSFTVSCGHPRNRRIPDCKSENKIVGKVENKNVGKPTKLFSTKPTNLYCILH